jgi:hypothetical protein
MPPGMTVARLSRAKQVREKRIKLGVLFRIPREFQRRGGRKRIVAPDGSEIAPSSKPQRDGTLMKALARAWRWQRMLDDGVYASVSEIGDAENISKSYVSRILRLALLSPDIVEAILAGTTEQSMVLEQLERPLPMSWAEQRAAVLSPARRISSPGSSWSRTRRMVGPSSRGGSARQSRSSHRSACLD